MNDTGKVSISEHAINRYVSLTKRPDRGRAEEILKRWLGRAERVKLDLEISAERIINNNFKEAEYYEYDAYRMVIVDSTMITFEEKYKSKKKYKPRKSRKR